MSSGGRPDHLRIGARAVRRPTGARPVARQQAAGRARGGAPARPEPHRARRADQRARSGGRHPAPRESAAPRRRGRRDPGQQPPSRRGRPHRRPHRGDECRALIGDLDPDHARDRARLLRGRASSTTRRRTDEGRDLGRGRQARRLDRGRVGSAGDRDRHLGPERLDAARRGDHDRPPAAGQARPGGHRRLAGLPARCRADHRRRRTRRLRGRPRLDVRPRVRRRHHHRPLRPAGAANDDRSRETDRLRDLGHGDEPAARDRPQPGRHRSPARPDRRRDAGRCWRARPRSA